MPVALLKQQYALIQGSRHALFAYCETISPQHFTQQINTFGHGSIRNLLVHVANTYIHWLPNHGLGGSVAYIDDGPVLSINDIYPIYQQTDQYVEDFLDHFARSLYTAFNRKLPTRNLSLTTTPLQLFTHATTHEMHHKGQILSMSRHLGYTPADTDVIRF